MLDKVRDQRGHASLDISPAIALEVDGLTWYASCVRHYDRAEGHTGGEHLLLAYAQNARPSSGELPRLPRHDLVVRIHSECLFGDVFGGHRCDCGPQLAQAREEIVTAGAGVLLYLRQEGRGVGLFDKIRSLLQQGDTFERNTSIGVPEDARGYQLAADILRGLGVTSVRLLSGNPGKTRALENAGIHTVPRIAFATNLTEEAVRELSAKIRKGYLYHGCPS